MNCNGIHVTGINSKDQKCIVCGEVPMNPIGPFTSWLKSHGCSVEELWKIQNCLLTVLGSDHPLAKEATEAWEKKRADEPFGPSDAKRLEIERILRECTVDGYIDPMSDEPVIKLLALIERETAKATEAKDAEIKSLENHLDQAKFDADILRLQSGKDFTKIAAKDALLEGAAGALEYYADDKNMDEMGAYTRPDQSWMDGGDKIVPFDNGTTAQNALAEITSAQSK
jgi:hypothetical protein